MIVSEIVSPGRARFSSKFKSDWLFTGSPLIAVITSPPIRVPTDADRDIMNQKQSEMRAALEQVRDLAESWFKLTEAEQDKLREEWRERRPPIERLSRKIEAVCSYRN